QRDPAHHLRVGEVERAVADFPDASVGPPPDLADVIGDAAENPADVRVDAVMAIAVDLRRLEQAAVDVVLDLLDRAVADAHRPRGPVPTQRQRALVASD